MTPPVNTFGTDEYLSIFIYLITTSITPGPGNIMCATCGANFGFIKSLPQVAGVTAGLMTLIFLGYTVFLQILLAYPTISLVIAIAGVLFMLYLAWNLSKSVLLRQVSTEGLHIPRMKKNMTFLKSYSMQMSNPKIWAMAITINTSYLRYATLSWSQTLLLFAFMTAVNFPCILFWAFLGSGPRELLQKNNRMKWFNAGMGILLALTAIHMGYEVTSHYYRTTQMH